MNKKKIYINKIILKKNISIKKYINKKNDKLIIIL